MVIKYKTSFYGSFEATLLQKDKVSSLSETDASGFSPSAVEIGSATVLSKLTPLLGLETTPQPPLTEDAFHRLGDLAAIHLGYLPSGSFDHDTTKVFCA